MKKITFQNQLEDIYGILYGNRTISKTFSELLSLRMEPIYFFITIFQMHVPINTSIADIIRRTCDERLRDEYFGFHNSIAHDEWICIHLVNDSAERGELSRLRQISAIRDMVQRISGLLGKSFTAAASSLHSDVMNLERAYKEAKYALSHQLTRGEGNLFEYEKNKAINGARSYYNHVSEETLMDKIIQQKTLNAKKIIEKIFREILDSDCVSIISIEETYAKTMEIINSAAKELGSGTGNDMALYPFLGIKELSAFYTSKDLLNHIFYCIDMVYSCGNNPESKEYAIIKNIKEYINENYYCDISLEMLAKHKYFLNPSYLSRLFKAKTGQKFSWYLQTVRMEKARELIQKGQFTITDISYFVGYTQPSYFIQAFKKYYGETPKNFKEISKTVNL